MKTSLTIDKLQAFLQHQFDEVDDLRRITEGEESQAFSFKGADKEYIVRINPAIDGFLKDKYAYEHFAAAKLPIPQVTMTGQIDLAHAFCVSENMSGITFQDADEATIERLLQPVTDVWQAIGDTDISRTDGFGVFDASGNGCNKSWQEYLLSVLEGHEWERLKSIIDLNLFEQLSAELRRFASTCPEERRLVHGDFGSNNLIVSDGRVAAVIDWGNALYGDPLFDVAYVYFWRTWLLCMEQSAAYWDSKLNGMPGYYQRLKCYQLRIGLHEIYDNAEDGDTKMLEWIQERCRQILKENP